VIGAGWYTGEALFGFGSGWLRVLAAIPLALIVFGAVGLERRDGVAPPAFMTHLGDASYAVYLWHVPLLAILGLVVARSSVARGSALREALVLGVCFAIVEVVALAIYRFIERPLTATLRELVLRRPPVAVRFEKS
jgi:exopolysaccharide production protein ExoZ